MKACTHFQFHKLTKINEKKNTAAPCFPSVRNALSLQGPHFLNTQSPLIGQLTHVWASTSNKKNPNNNQIDSYVPN